MVERLALVLDIQSGRTVYITRDVVKLPGVTENLVKRRVKRDRGVMWERRVLGIKRFTELYDLGDLILRHGDQLFSKGDK
jgi:hypothetical protein